MSMFDEKQSSSVSAEPRTIYRDRASGKAGKGSSTAKANSAVNSALSTAGQGQSHPSGASFHDDATSHEAASALGANAFTAGNDVFFAQGKYNPGTSSGDRLIQHELTHVQQSKGVAPPTPGNFSVSSPSDTAEVAARSGESGGSANASTIYRDGEDTPQTTGDNSGTETNTESTETAESGGEEANAYDEWKTAVNGYDATAAIAKYGTLSTEDKAKIKDEGGTFHRRVIFVMQKDSVIVIKEAGLDITEFNYAIFLRDDFPLWLPELRTHGLLNTFLDAQPRKHIVSQSESAKLKTWVDATSSSAEAKRIFEKVWPTLNDTATPALPFSATSVAWSLAHIQRLYGILDQYMNPGHAATITGGINLAGGVGFGWWEPGNKRVALPNNPGASNAGSDTFGHGMTGGGARGTNDTGGRTGRRVNPDYEKEDGTNVTGNNARMGHFVGTVLHEVGHGVGSRVDGGRGNAYAENSGSWPGFNVRMDLGTWCDELWTAGASGTGSEPAVHKNAKLDDKHAKDFMKTELGGGTYKPGWRNNPPRGDMATYVKWRYADVPLQKWWNYFVENGMGKQESYAWDNEDARLKNGWCYSYLVRGNSQWTKFKEHTWTNKVSWYSLSSPKEWFAEQYTHFYRTEKSGDGLDGDTLSLLKDLDKKDFVPTSDDGQTGVSIGAEGASSEGGGGGTGADAAEQEGGPEGGAPENPEVEPLMFPW